MRVFWATAVVLVFSAFTLGQSSHSTETANHSKCPVAFDSVNPYRTGPKPLEESHFYVQWRNTTDKVIVGAKFKVAFYDSTNDRHESTETWSTSQKAKPGEKKHTTWEDEYWAHTYGRRAKAEIWPVKLLFEDGSTWEDDGSRSCVGNTTNNKGSWWTR